MTSRGDRPPKSPVQQWSAIWEQSLWNGAPEGTSTLNDEWNEGGIFLLGQCLVLESLLAGAEMRGCERTKGEREKRWSSRMDNGDVAEKEGLCEITREGV